MVDADARGAPLQGVKVGGRPGLVQGADALGPSASLAGLGFLFQLDEEAYPDDMRVGSLLFAGGVLYVFTEDATQGLVALWQST